MKPKTAQKLRNAIVKSGISQNELARRTEIAQASISVFLAGGGTRLELAERMADAIGLKLDLKKA